MGTDVSSVEEIRKRIRHAQKNEMFLFEINCGNHSRYWFHFQSFSGFTLMDGWDSFKGNIAVVSKKNAAAFLGKPKEAVTEEEVLKRLAKEAEIIEQAINGDLFEVCGPNPMIFVATVGFWMKKTLQSLRRRNTRTLSTKTRISEQSTNLKQPN